MFDPTKPVLLTGRSCSVMTWDQADVKELSAVANDASVAQHMPRCFPHPYSEADAQTWIDQHYAENPQSHFAIVADGSIAGGITIDLGAQDALGSGEIGYFLGKSFWGKAIATEALTMLTQAAFKTYRLHRLWASVLAPNKASARVLQKAGYQLEGTLREARLDRRDVATDLLLFARVVH